MKRGWLEGPRMSDALFKFVSELMGGPGLLQALAGAVLLAVLGEFSSGPRSTEMNMSWEFHHQSQRAFEEQSLPRIFTQAMNVLAPVAQSGLDSRMPDASHTTLLTFLAVAERTLCWPFTSKRAMAGSFEDRGDTPPFTPPASWKSVFEDLAVVDMFFAVRSCRSWGWCRRAWMYA